MTISIFSELRSTLRPLSLHESDFLASDAVANQIAAFKGSIEELNVSDEPWLRE